MTSADPLVSVCIASYNHARYLPGCLDSILSQTYPNVEIIIVDDGSQDNSHEVLTDYQNRYPDTIHYSWHDGHANRGYSYSCNLAMQQSKGKYIAWIGSDDTWRSDKLERQVSLMELRPELGFTYSYAQYVDEEGRQLPELAGLDITQDPNPTGIMLQTCHPPAMATMILRSFMEEIGLFDETLIYSDWDLMVRAIARRPAAFIDEPLANYRIHGKNVSKRIDPKVDLQRILAFTEAVQRKSQQIGGSLLWERNQAILALQLSFLYFCLGEEEKACDLAKQAFLRDPSLASDVEFLDGWLNRWKPDFYTPALPHFGLWFIDHLTGIISQNTRELLAERQMAHPDTKQFFVRRGIERGQAWGDPDEIFNNCPASIPMDDHWKAGVLKQVYPALLFDAVRQGKAESVRRFWIQTIRFDPSWIANRGVWSIGFKAFFGPHRD